MRSGELHWRKKNEIRTKAPARDCSEKRRKSGACSGKPITRTVCALKKMSDRDVLKMRLDRFLAMQGLCTMRSVRGFLRTRTVLVNGAAAGLKRLIDSERDSVSIDGQTAPPMRQRYVMMNKPRGAVCSRTSDRRQTVYELLSPLGLTADELRRMHTVGRLDADTEGLLLLTTNGSYSHTITSPESAIPKTYLAYLEKYPDAAAREAYRAACAAGILLPAEKKAGACFASGAELAWEADASYDGKRCAACSITLTEGRFHEVKRIFAALGNAVLYLRRTRIGSLCLNEHLSVGSSICLSEEDALSATESKDA